MFPGFPVRISDMRNRFSALSAKATYALSLFLLAATKKAVIVSFRQDTKVLTAARTAGSASVCRKLLPIS